MSLKVGVLWATESAGEGQRGRQSEERRRERRWRRRLEQQCSAAWTVVTVKTDVAVHRRFVLE